MLGAVYERARRGAYCWVRGREARRGMTSAESPTDRAAAVRACAAARARGWGLQHARRPCHGCTPRGWAPRSGACGGARALSMAGGGPTSDTRHPKRRGPPFAGVLAAYTRRVAAIGGGGSRAVGVFTRSGQPARPLSTVTSRATRMDGHSPWHDVAWAYLQCVERPARPFAHVYTAGTRVHSRSAQSGAQVPLRGEAVAPTRHASVKWWHKEQHDDLNKQPRRLIYTRTICSVRVRAPRS